ncbi:phage tail protein, partial [Acinetobacter baumannii]
MATYYIGQIVLFAADYVPEGFLPCDGQQLQIQDNLELYSLLGQVYGG